MAKKKKHKARCDELVELIKESVKIAEEKFPTGELFLNLYLTESDGRALSKYINWNESSESKRFRVGTISKFSTDRVSIKTLQAYNLNETKIQAVPKGNEPITAMYPFSNNTPSSYEDALENVRGLATDAYKSMLPGNNSRKEENNDE